MFIPLNYIITNIKKKIIPTSFEGIQKDFLPLVFYNNRRGGMKEKKTILLNKLEVEERMIKELHKENEYKSYMIKLRK
jgi:hypothetical protein